MEAQYPSSSRGVGEGSLFETNEGVRIETPEGIVVLQPVKPAVGRYEASNRIAAVGLGHYLDIKL